MQAINFTSRLHHILCHDYLIFSSCRLGLGSNYHSLRPCHWLLTVFPTKRSEGQPFKRPAHRVERRMRVLACAHDSKCYGNPHLVTAVTRQRMWGWRRQGFQTIVHCFLNTRIDFHAPLSALLECCEFWSELPHILSQWFHHHYLILTSYFAGWDLRSNN